ncbi:LLM class flavin-dependent oxidoreductase, partial [Streptomyces xinghaiensis]
GESLNEVPSTGLVWPELKERSARLREAVKLIRRLWSEDRVTFEGEYYKTQNATIYDRPNEMVPIYLAAGGPLNAKYAGRAGDGFICTSGKGAELYVDQLLPNVAIGRAESDRSDKPFERMIEVKVSFDT